jgi:hypothetical protein
MRVLSIRIILALLLVAAAQTSGAGQSTGKHHVLLFDVSGSMKDRYAGDLKNWLIQPLLTSSAFGSNDRVLVRWFDQRGNIKFSAEDPQRRYFAKMDTSEVLKRVPTVDDATGANTDLLEAIKMTLLDLENLKIQGDVLIWMVTDNEQDAGGKEDPTPFYQSIVGDEHFRAAYLFPLVKEKDGRPPTKNAMVLYLLSYSMQPSSFKLDNIADSATKKISQPAVTWFPIETGIDINSQNIRVNDEPAMVEDGKLKLPPVNEGETPNFSITFPFTSRLRARKLVRSLIKDQKVVFGNLPTSLEARGDVTSWTADISPKTLTIEPNKNSEVNYVTTLGANDLTLHPTSFVEALKGSLSDPVDIRFQYAIVDDDPKIESAEVAQVKDLDKIAGNLRVRSGQKNIRPGQIQMSFQVQYNSLWRRLLVAGLLLFALVLGAGLAFALLSKGQYVLSSSLGEQVLALPLIGRSYITINADRAAVISKKFAKLTVAPLGTYTLNGELKPVGLADNTENNFTIDSQTDGRRYSYSLRRLVTQPNVPLKDDHSWDL